MKAERDGYMAVNNRAFNLSLQQKANELNQKAVNLTREYAKMCEAYDIPMSSDIVKPKVAPQTGAKPTVGIKVNAKTASDIKANLTKSVKDDILIKETIAVGDVTDNFSRKAQPTEYTEDLKATNPNYSTKEYKWQNNCQRCVPTYEMRRRGYNVTAKPQPQSDLSKDHLAMRPWDAWKNPNLQYYRNKEDIERAMAKMGDGARTQIYIAWGNGGGHTFVAEQKNGKTIFLDPQTENSDCSRYFKSMYKGNKFTTSYFWRIDNLEPSDLMKECCL